MVSHFHQQNACFVLFKYLKFQNALPLSQSKISLLIVL